MDDLVLIDKLKKRLNATLQQIGDSMITGGLTVWKNISICWDKHTLIN
jgi:predicted O-methyltransferase YrrM